MALGASIIERHFTDTKKRSGPDIVNSMNPIELNELSNAAREIHLMKKNNNKGLVLEEKNVKEFAFATLVAIKHIKKGERLTFDNIWAKRPGVGKINASEMNKVLGAVAIKEIKIDHHINYKDIKLKN